MAHAKTRNELFERGFLFDRFAFCDKCGAPIERFISPRKKANVPFNRMSAGDEKPVNHYRTCPVEIEREHERKAAA